MLVSFSKLLWVQLTFQEWGATYEKNKSTFLFFSSFFFLVKGWINICCETQKCHKGKGRSRRGGELQRLHHVPLRRREKRETGKTGSCLEGRRKRSFSWMSLAGWGKSVTLRRIFSDLNLTPIRVKRSPPASGCLQRHLCLLPSSAVKQQLLDVSTTTGDHGLREFNVQFACAVSTDTQTLARATYLKAKFAPSWNNKKKDYQTKSYSAF